MFTASKLWMPGPQDCIFQHLLEPEVGPEGAILNLIQPKRPSCIEDGCVQILFSQLFQFWRRQLTTTPGIKRFSFMNMYRCIDVLPKKCSSKTMDKAKSRIFIRQPSLNKKYLMKYYMLYIIWLQSAVSNIHFKFVIMWILMCDV